MTLLLVAIAPAATGQQTASVQLFVEDELVYRAPGSAAAIRIEARDANGPVAQVRVRLLETNETALTNSRGLALFSLKRETAGEASATFEGQVVRAPATPVAGVRTRVVWTEVRVALQHEPAQPRPGDEVHVVVHVRASHDEAPIRGMPVTLEDERETHNLTTGEDGAARATLRSDAPRIAQLRATARASALGFPQDERTNATIAWTRPLDEAAPLVARVEAPTQVFLREAFLVTARAEGGEAIAWWFDMGDGTLVGPHGESELAHVYAAPGEYVGSVRAIDASGREGPPATFTIRAVENRSMTLRLLAPPAYRDGLVVAEGMAEAPDRGIRRIEARVNMGAWTEARGSEAWAVDIPANLSAGTHTLEVRAIDLGGAQETHAFTFTVEDKAEAARATPGPGLLTVLAAAFILVRRRLPPA